MIQSLWTGSRLRKTVTKKKKKLPRAHSLCSDNEIINADPDPYMCKTGNYPIVEDWEEVKSLLTLWYSLSLVIPRKTVCRNGSYQESHPAHTVSQFQWQTLLWLRLLLRPKCFVRRVLIQQASAKIQAVIWRNLDYSEGFYPKRVKFQPVCWESFSTGATEQWYEQGQGSLGMNVS